jgi:hypothetical protein
MNLRIAATAALFVLVGGAPAPARAWGPRGHRLVAEIAWRHLTPEAKKRVRELLRQGETLSTISTWPDEIRAERKWTSRWHYVNIPREAKAFDRARDCPTRPEGDCVVAAIERVESTLQDPRAPREDRREALSFLVHLVGDLHQPLHSTDDRDRGGNDRKVSWFGRPTNLHRVWDDHVLEDQEELRRHCRATGEAQRKRASARPDLRPGALEAWAMESHAAGWQHAYALPPSGELACPYFLQASRVVEAQLGKAGERLAAMIERDLAVAARR